MPVPTAFFVFRKLYLTNIVGDHCEQRLGQEKRIRDCTVSVVGRAHAQDAFVFFVERADHARVTPPFVHTNPRGCARITQKEEIERHGRIGAALREHATAQTRATTISHIEGTPRRGWLASGGVSEGGGRRLARTLREWHIVCSFHYRRVLFLSHSLVFSLTSSVTYCAFCVPLFSVKISLAVIETLACLEKSRRSCLSTKYNVVLYL